jgi:phosphate transport system substrate-binding protein
MVSRALKPEEDQQLNAITIAWDGIAIIVHASNPIKELTEDEVRQIFQGQVTNWSAFGGPDTRIVVVNKAQGRSTLELFLDYFGLKAEEIRASTVIGDNQQGIKVVAGNPAAIGYVSVGAAEFAEAQGTPLRSLPLKGIASTRENVQNGRYPLRRPLNLVFKGEPTGSDVRGFFAFVRSAAADDIIEDLYFVPPAR